MNKVVKNLIGQNGFVIGMLAVVFVGIVLVVTIKTSSLLRNETECLSEYDIQFPIAAMFAGNRLVQETNMQKQPVLATGLRFEDNKQFYFIEGQIDTAIGELCWIGNPRMAEPSFLWTSIEPSKSLNLRDK